MSLFVLTVGNLIFILCILLICERFIILDKREQKYKYLIFFCTVIIESLLEYYCRNIYVKGLIIIFATTFILYTWYKETCKKIILVSIWLFLLVSVFSLIGEVAVNVVLELLQWKENILVDVIVIIFVFIFLYIISIILQRKNHRGVKDIKTGYLLLYTCITIIDAMILALMAIVTLEEIAYKNVILYSIIFILVTIGIYVQLSMVIMLMVSRDMYKEKEEITHKYLNEQQEHYTYLEEREKETKKFRHDINFHMFILEELRNKSNDEYNEYLGEVIERVERLRKKLSVYNDVVDAILYKFYDIAEENNIKFTVTGHMPPVCYIETYDLCSIFYNLLNNAVEASEKVDKKEIEVDVSYSDEDIIIIIKNYFDGKIQTEDNEILTGKHDKNLHGWGMQNVKDSVNKYNGIMDIEIDNNIFSVTILLKNVIKEIL